MGQLLDEKGNPIQEVALPSTFIGLDTSNHAADATAYAMVALNIDVTRTARLNRRREKFEAMEAERRRRMILQRGIWGLHKALDRIEVEALHESLLLGQLGDRIKGELERSAAARQGSITKRFNALELKVATQTAETLRGF